MEHGAYAQGEEVKSVPSMILPGLIEQPHTRIRASEDEIEIIQN
jgi:hypothetical protein